MNVGSLYQYADFGALKDSYLPSPIKKKSAKILQMQEKWSNTGDSDKPHQARRFNSYRQIEKPCLEVLQSPVPGIKSYRNIDSPKSVLCARNFSSSSTDSLRKPKPSVVVPKKAEEQPVSDGKSALRTSIPPVSLSAKEVESSPVTIAVQPKKVTKTYTRWEFGKAKNFERPPSTPQTNKAAIAIQRIARGGLQRLHYKVARLEWMLSTGVREKTHSDVLKIHQELDQRKAKYATKMEEESKKESKMLAKARTTAEEAHKLIAYLRKQNKELREKNEKVYKDIVEMKENNARLEAANEEMENNMTLLKEHFEEIEKTHAKLMEVVPKYEESIQQLKEAIGVRNMYGSTEHKIKVHYVKLMGEIVECLEASTREEVLAEEVVQTILELEEEELKQGRLPHTDKQ